MKQRAARGSRRAVQIVVMVVMSAVVLAGCGSRATPGDGGETSTRGVPRSTPASARSTPTHVTPRSTTPTAAPRSTPKSAAPRSTSKSAAPQPRSTTATPRPSSRTSATQQQFSEYAIIKTYFTAAAADNSAWVHFKAVDGSGRTVTEALGSDLMNLVNEADSTEQNPKRWALVNKVRQTMVDGGWTELGVQGEWYQYVYGR